MLSSTTQHHPNAIQSTTRKMTASNHTENALVAIGNPLLDISAEVTPKFLEKYAL